MTPLHPWQRGWLYWAPGKGRVLLWLAGLHAAAIVGVILAPPPSVALPVLAMVLNLPGTLGLSLAFHRSLAHRAVRFHHWLEQILILLAMLNGSGSPCSWAATHRIHHRHEDTIRDVSSPVIGGFWWAHLRWLWQSDPIPEEAYPPSLRSERYLRWDRWEPYILVIALLLPVCFGFTAWVWLGPVRLLHALHGQALANSAGHTGARGERGGTSRNLPWIAAIQLFVGESWHRNHHTDPASARIGWRWWQIDLGWLVIRCFAAIGLATEVRRRGERRSQGPTSRGSSGWAHHSISPPS